MNLAKTALLTCVSTLALFSASRELGQSSAGIMTAVLPNEPKSAYEVPTRLLEFRRGDPITGLTASPVTMIPAQCTSDGTLFVDMLTPPDLAEHTVYGLQGTKSVKFSPGSVPGLHELQVLQFFPTDAGVSFLIRATKETATAPASVRSANGETATVEKSRGALRYFVATFDRRGQYKETGELAINYPLFGFAALTSGEFIVSGYDQANDTERLLLLDAHGAVVRPILPPTANVPRDPGAEEPQWKHDHEAAMSANTMMFIGHGESVLMWRRGTRDPVLEIRSGGATREVPVALPKGYVLADLAPSDGSWIVHVRKDDLDDGKPGDYSAMAYFEVMPQDGSILRRLLLPIAVTGQIACKSGGTYLSYATDEKSRLVELTAQ